ncbi:MAG: hypothetical protein DRP74_03045 [Candidatus Omnitrophota bacterium]|nr:MAG: hypothetical protein DRP74_03045 [Candidatus Omnitrophota bacterium]
MAEEIKELIAKIQQEGIQAAEDKAREIEAKARAQAEELLKQAKSQAEKIVNDAKSEALKTEESTKTLLKQAGRDLILSLKEEINTLLKKLIVGASREALKPQETVKLIASLVKNCREKDKENVTVTVGKADLEKIEAGLLSELGREIKRGISLKGRDDISTGFIISFDSGKSHFDFTDQAIAEYIGSYLKPKLKEILE